MTANSAVICLLVQVSHHYHVNLKKNWNNFKDLIDIELVSIDDNSFTVLVSDTDTKWHSSFSREVCKKVELDNLKITTDSDAFLFHVTVL